MYARSMPKPRTSCGRIYCKLLWTQRDAAQRRQESVLELKNIRKSYGGVAALKDGNLKVSAGEVHLLLGENGAGKSTLMKIVAGMVERDGGEMLWNGKPVNVRTPAEAAAIGIAMVHQESLLAPHLSVAENIFLGREQTNRAGWLRRGKMLEEARTADRAASLSAAARMARRALESRGQATGGDLPRAAQRVEPADL